MGGVGAREEFGLRSGALISAWVGVSSDPWEQSIVSQDLLLGGVMGRSGVSAHRPPSWAALAARGEGQASGSS